MDEVKSVFYSELKDKSVTARGAHNMHRQRNNNKRYTRKELKKMNGETYSMNVNEFIPFKEFRKLPKTMQKEWIEAQIEKYGVCKSSFAKLWEVYPSTTWSMFREFKIESPQYDLKKEKKFLCDMKPKADKSNPIPETASETVIESKSVTPVNSSSDFVVDLIQIDTDVKFENHEEVFRFFNRFISLNADMHITLRIEKKAGDNK